MNLFRKKKTSPASASQKEEIQAIIPCLSKELTDAGQFSYVAMCALGLLELYPDSHKEFKQIFLKKVLKQMNQSSQVEASAMALMEGHGSDNYDPFVHCLLAEPMLKDHGIEVILQNMVTVCLQDGDYDARYRVLIRRISDRLKVDFDEVEEFEKTVVNWLKQEEHKLTDEEIKEKEGKALTRKIKRFAMVGAATVGGGVLLGLTGGLAAPVLAAGVGTIIGTAGGAALASTAGVAIIGSLFGVAGAGLGGFKMRKRVGDVEEFQFEPLTNLDDMHVTITVTGWLTEKEPDCRFPWRNIYHSGEQFTLRYETKYLIEMGQGMDYLMGFAVNAAAGEALKYTILSGILAAVTWPATLVSAASIIDNPWSVCINRTSAAGKQLAEVLLSRQQGKRPVTLVGYSLGARVIFCCLQELARRKNTEGIVQDAVMLGTPVTASVKEWAMLGNVVSGRVINGFCRSDWLLKFLYRTASVQFTIAGLQRIRWENRRMINIDLTDVVEGHLDYRNKLDYILGLCSIKTKDARMYSAETATEATEGADSWTIIHKGDPKMTKSRSSVLESRSSEQARISRETQSVDEALSEVAGASWTDPLGVVSTNEIQPAVAIATGNKENIPNLPPSNTDFTSLGKSSSDVEVNDIIDRNSEECIEDNLSVEKEIRITSDKICQNSSTGQKVEETIQDVGSNDCLVEKPKISEIEKIEDLMKTTETKEIREINETQDIDDSTAPEETTETEETSKPEETREPEETKEAEETIEAEETTETEETSEPTSDVPMKGEAEDELGGVIKVAASDDPMKGEAEDELGGMIKVAASDDPMKGGAEDELGGVIKVAASDGPMKGEAEDELGGVIKVTASDGPVNGEAEDDSETATSSSLKPDDTASFLKVEDRSEKPHNGSVDRTLETEQEDIRHTEILVREGVSDNKGKQRSTEYCDRNSNISESTSDVHEL